MWAYSARRVPDTADQHARPVGAQEQEDTMPRTLAEIRSDQAVNKFVDLVEELEKALQSSKDAMASRLC